MSLFLVAIIPVLQGQQPFKEPAPGHIAMAAQCITVMRFSLQGLTLFVHSTIHFFFYAPMKTCMRSRQAQGGKDFSPRLRLWEGL